MNSATNPTNYRGYKITYVDNDVDPGTETATATGPTGDTLTTSARIFMHKRADGTITNPRWYEDWIGDICDKVDTAIEQRHPTRKIHEPRVRPLE